MRRWPRTTPSTRTRVVLVVARIPCAALSRRCGCQKPSQPARPHRTACIGTTTNCCVKYIHNYIRRRRHRATRTRGRRTSSERRDGWRRLCTNARTSARASRRRRRRRRGNDHHHHHHHHHQRIIMTTTMGNEPQPQPVTVTVSAALSRVIGHIHGTPLDASQRSDVLRRLDRHIDESSRKVRRDARFDFARRRARHRGW